MRLFPMRTFPASANGESWLGPVFRPLTDSDQHSFQYSYVIALGVWESPSEAILFYSIPICRLLLQRIYHAKNIART